MKEVDISSEVIDEARTKAKDLGKVYRSITGGAGNLAGFIGESLARSVYGGKVENTLKYDLVFPNGQRIDVKTKRTSVKPKMEYDCSVSDFQIEYDCDGYVFVRVLNDLTIGWVLGHISKEDFKKNSTYYKKGERDKSNGFLFRQSCYNIKISELSVP